MKIQNNIVYISAFVYILFSYATILPESAIDVHSWIIIIVVNFRIALFLCFFTINNRQILPLADLVLIFCIIFLMAEQIIKINRYMKTYHRQSPVWVNYIITLAVIIIVHSYDIKKTEKLSVPLAVTAMLTIVLIIVMNISKSDPSNLYRDYNSTDLHGFDITLFEYLIPLSVILNYKQSSDKKKTSVFILSTGLALITITIFIFSCTKGNLMYSISPLQIAFQLSESSQVANFDVYYSFLLWISYFAAIVFLFQAWKCIKQRFAYFNGSELLLVIPFTVLQYSLPLYYKYGVLHYYF